ncbi:hypothetical protein ZOSMA_5G00620 [Zostera marina]|uniref:ABC transporter domain-containing protein n=1 Tax=Zostera marina TaxID=29655 RepID=A0A0K9NTV7_ZOSMR|nr:hypothetical protein ZOSMA_5G00620 [Zostera marina]
MAGNMTEPLLLRENNTMGFGNSSFISKACYLRMNPLMKKGYKAPLKIDASEICNALDGIAVEVEEGDFEWNDQVPEGKQPSLSNINLKIKKGSLAAVDGMVGSGKSSLLACLLGEMNKITGKVRICGSTAYVAQTAWIQNGTIKDNILFGLPMDGEKYDNVIHVCCLYKDLEMMNSVTKQRSNVYFLDAHTGSELYRKCVRGALKGKTVILVTHQVDFLHNADIILVMKSGKIVQTGKYDELLVNCTDFSVLVSAHGMKRREKWNVVDFERCFVLFLHQWIHP